jgi:hypothetical protein
VRDLEIVAARRVAFRGHRGDSTAGAFVMASSDDNGMLRIIASAGNGWDHVSISREDRTPTWSEMEQVKRSFFKDDEVAMQLHVTPTSHINVHPYCLHLWRPHKTTIPLPPAIMV